MAALSWVTENGMYSSKNRKSIRPGHCLYCGGLPQINYCVGNTGAAKSHNDRWHDDSALDTDIYILKKQCEQKKADRNIKPALGKCWLIHLETEQWFGK